MIIGRGEGGRGRERKKRARKKEKNVFFFNNGLSEAFYLHQRRRWGNFFECSEVETSPQNECSFDVGSFFMNLNTIEELNNYIESQK